jgi:hypothetical protein
LNGDPGSPVRCETALLWNQELPTFNARYADAAEQVIGIAKE